MRRWLWWVPGALWMVAVACDDGGGGAPPPDLAVDAAPVVDAAPDATPPEVCLADGDCPEGSRCVIRADQFEGVCAPGCRLRPDSCAAADPQTLCDPESFRCARRPCADDRACDAGQWCDAGTCREGCRTAPDSCPDLNGGAQRCAPETRRCVPLYACCAAAGAAEETCSLTRANACAGQLFVGLASCEPSPCTPPCTGDADCGAAEWCDPGLGRCQVGCRLGERLACPAHEACDPALRRCVQALCAADADCPGWQFCRDGRCFEGCRAGGCGPVARCDAELRLCVPDCDPFTHAPCGPGARCDGERLRCVPGCADDLADMQSDADDDPDTTPDLPPRREGALRIAEVSRRVACPGDLDAHAFVLQPDERLQISLQQSLAGGALRLRLLGPDGALLVEDRTLAQSRRLRWPATPEAAPPGRYVVVLEAPGEAAVPDYSLRFEALDARRACFGDARDPGDDGVAGATPFGRAVAGRSTARFTGDLCASDVDWFCTELGAEDGVTARLVLPPGCGPVAADLRDRLLADRPGPHLLRPEPPTPEGQAWTFVGPPSSGRFTAGTWCLRLASVDPAAICEDYSLELTVDRPLEACTDTAEPNDGVATATVLDGEGPLADLTGRLPTGVDLRVPLLDLQICEGERDVFAFDADPGDALRAWLVLDAEQQAALRGSLELRFLDANGAPRGSLARNNLAGQDRLDQALTVAAGPGRLHVEVRGIAASTGPYQLFVRRDPGDGQCSADLYENAGVRSDTPEDAAALSPQEGPERLGVQNAAICHPRADLRDVDWYRFDVAQDATRLCLEARFRHADGDLDLGLFWGGEERALPCETDEDCDFGSHCVLALCREPLLSGVSRNDGELLPLSPAEVRAGPYLVRVEGVDGAENSYDLLLTQIPPGRGCAPDWRERDRSNDQPQVATELGAGRIQICDAWLCHGERNTGDWYAIDVPAGQDRTVHIAFEPRRDGILLMHAYGAHAPGQVAAAEEIQANVQCINLRADPLQDRRALVQITADTVHQDGDDRVDYTFRVVPTDLSRNLRGACDTLSGGIFVNVPWPLLDL